MYITLQQQLPAGTIINVFHPAASEPIAVTPQDYAGYHTFVFMYAAPYRALGQMVGHNNAPTPAQPNTPQAANQQPNPTTAGGAYRVHYSTLLQEFVTPD
jgi:hypothetical protein